MKEMTTETYDLLVSQMIMDKLSGSPSIRWDKICKEYVLPEDLFNYVVDNINAKSFGCKKWGYLTDQLLARKTLTLDTLEKYKYKLYWGPIVETNIVNDEFVTRFLKRIGYVANIIFRLHSDKLSKHVLVMLEIERDEMDSKLKNL